MELGRKFLAEGEAGARSVCLKLKKTKWLPQQLVNVDEKDLYTNHPLPGFRDTTGRTRLGSIEYDIKVRAASASCVRRGTKFDRAVTLNDVTKIARLSLKLALSFVDRPATGFALFQGLRTSEAAQWCAETLVCTVKRLMRGIHVYKTEELQEVLEATLKELDTEVMKSAFPFSGCSALLALLLGNRFVVAGVGDCRVLLLEGEGKGAGSTRLLDCEGRLDDEEEQLRFWQAGGMDSWLTREHVVDGLLHHQQADKLDDAKRILCAPNVFDVLLAPDDELDVKQVRGAYRKLALKVHPDKQKDKDSVEMKAYQYAFARLEEILPQRSKERLEGMIEEDLEACKQMRRVLHAEVHTRSGAASLLGVDWTPASDSILEEIDSWLQTGEQDAAKAAKELKKKFAKLQAFAPDFGQAETICDEAVRTMARPCTVESLPRTEALLKEGLQMSRVRDLRSPRSVVVMEPKSASHFVSTSATIRFALLCGATAALKDDQLVQSAASHCRRPKASALAWNALTVLTEVCISISPSGKAEAPAAKRQKTAQGADTVRARHILLRHQQVRQADPMLRRDPGRSLQEAEELALKTLETLTKTPMLGVR
eukprot:g4474.t1